MEGWRRVGDELQEITELNGWVSPRLGITFDLNDNNFRILGPNGLPLETYVDIASRAERLAAKLRALGVDPDA